MHYLKKCKNRLALNTQPQTLIGL